jgi:RHS repeat-associated protein
MPRMGKTVVVAVTDASGTLRQARGSTLIDQQRYLPFGAERTDVTSPSAAGTDYGYTGQRELDPSTGGLMDYKARFYSVYLNRFVQSDTIVPNMFYSQSLNRYAYVNNSPMNYVDPSGHICVESDGDSDVGMAGNCHGGSNPKYEPGLQGPKWSPRRGNPKLPEPSGNNVELNIIAGISVEAEGYDGNPTSIGLLYFSIGLVTDNTGEFQFYYSTMNKTYIPGSSSHMGGYLSGPAEKDRPSNAYGLGISASYGVIIGKDFKTGKFLGEGYSTSYPTGTPFSVGHSEPYDKNLNYDVYSLSFGGGFSMGTVSTHTEDIGNPIQIPSQFVPMCQRVGFCGAYPSINPHTVPIR